jgi:hypothetical protein
MKMKHVDDGPIVIHGVDMDNLPQESPISGEWILNQKQLAGLQGFKISFPSYKNGISDNIWYGAVDMVPRGRELSTVIRHKVVCGIIDGLSQENIKKENWFKRLLRRLFKRYSMA